MTYLRIVMWITIFALSGCYQILGFSEFEFETNDTATSTNGSDTETASESNIDSDTVEPNTLSSLETGTSSDTHQKSAADTATDSDTRNNAVSPRESPSGTDSEPPTTADMSSPTADTLDTDTASQQVDSNDTSVDTETPVQSDIVDTQTTDTTVFDATTDTVSSDTGMCADNTDCPICHICDTNYTCAPAADDIDPKNECAEEQPATCGLTGNCDGQGDCAFFHTETSCDDGNPMTMNDACNGTGSCTGTDYCSLYDCWKIPPSGQDKCYELAYDDTFPCTSFPCDDDGSPTFCGQDAQYPDNPRVFTCFDSNGAEQINCDNSADPDEVVSDSLTGLVWQRLGQEDLTLEDASEYCENLEYGGEENWRLPNIYELFSLFDFGRTVNFIDPVLFQGSESTGTVIPSSNTAPDDSDSVYGVNSYQGIMTTFLKTVDNSQTRCVFGHQVDLNEEYRFYPFEQNGQSLVLDRATGLVWQQDHATNGNWQESLAYCEALVLGGRDDWRLPSITELVNLVDFETGAPPAAFQSMTTGRFYSSTTQFYIGGGNNALTVDFDETLVFSDNKDQHLDVRCVREGP